MNTHTSKIVHYVSLGAVLALCFSIPGLPDARAADEPNPGQLSAKDYKFVTDAAQGGALEATLGQLAAQKAGDESVRDFGRRMIQDHKKADQQLTELLSQKGATLPESSSKKDGKTTEHLLGLSGSEFDRAYIKLMVGDHKNAIKEFEKEADKAGDADLKNWVIKTLPTLREHLRLAESVEATINSAIVQASSR